MTQPSAPDRLSTLQSAVRHLENGRFGAAAELCRPLAARNAGDIDAHFLLGLALGGLGQKEEAIRLLYDVVRERPGHPDAHRELARILQASGRRPEAEAQYRVAITVTPGDALTLCDFGRFLLEDGRWEEAAAMARAALAMAPDLGAAHNLLGVARAGQGRMTEAIDSLRRAVAADPQSASAPTNLGTALATERRFAESLDAFAKALAIAPNDITIRLNRATTLLKSGNFADGWTEFEWRHRKPGREKLPPALRLPKITNRGQLAGRRIVVYHEEGFGDTIQFLRYLPQLAETGATVIAWMPRELVRLTEQVAGVAQVLTGDVTLPEFDSHCPINSLPYVFDTTIETIPIAVPYVEPAPDLTSAWRKKLPETGRPRIGLVWSGEPRAHDLAATAIDRRRSIPLALLAPLRAAKEASLVSLQMGSARAELANAPEGLEIFDPMAEVRDFADTAAIIDSLDLVISVDTAVVHLAGAMGKPVFLLDRYDNCWRWLSGREDSPWYPTLRIFRQARIGDWGPVVARVVDALRSTLPS